MNKPSLVFFGTSDFSRPVLLALQKAEFDIKKIIDKTTDLADIPAADVYVIASFGAILPPSIINAPKHGTLNVHPSLLPQFRGPSPIQSALLAGEQKTGVSIMLTNEKMDHGPIIAQEILVIKKDEYYPELQNRLAELGGSLVARIIPDWVAGKIKAQEQNHRETTFTKLIKKEDGKIDWNEDADIILRKIRAYTPWPSTWTTLDSKMIKILRARAGTTFQAKPGTLALVHEELVAACGDNTSIVIEEIQLEGKQPTSGKAFANGYLRGELKQFS